MSCGARGRSLLALRLFQVVTGSAFSHRVHLAHGGRVIAQRLGGVAGRVRSHLFGRALGHDQPTGTAALGAEVDQPVGGADHVQVVFDHDQRMPGLQQLAQRAHELGDVVEVQTGGGLVEQEQRAFLGQRLAAGGAVLGRLGQETRELEALRFATRERGHGLTELHVLQPHVHDGLQRTDDLSVGLEQLGRFADRQVQHIGHVEQASTALDLHLQNFRPVTLAVAVGAAQVHVAQELHFHMLEARAAAGGAAAVAAVEAEFARGVAALARQRRVGKQGADRVPGADIAHRVGARGLADGRLVHEHHFAQKVGTEQAVVCAGRIGRFAEVAQQRGREHVLDQTGLARTRDAGDHHQPLQRELDAHVLQVVFARAFQDQARRAVGHHALEAHAHRLARAEVGAGQGVGAANLFRRAVEHDLPAAFARSRAHVDQAVRGEHHRRVVLHHHQGVARIAQTQHGLVDARHVARVQADARFVEHEQRVDQRGAERGGEVDALHLATAQCAALAVQREVANAHLAQVPQPGVDFLKQQTQRLRLTGAREVRTRRHQGLVERRKEHPQLVQRQQHQVVQTEAGQHFQLRARPLHAFGCVTPVRRQHRIGLLFRADAPQQAVGLQAGAAAAWAFGVAAVLGQEHPDVHLVGLALQILEETVHTKPVLVPFAVPVRRAGFDPVLLLGRELVPGRVARDTGGFGVAHQVVLGFFPGRGGPDGGVEREHRRRGFAVANVALGAMQAR